MIQEKRSSFLYIYNATQVLFWAAFACLHQSAALENYFMNPLEAAWFEVVTDAFNAKQWY